MIFNPKDTSHLGKSPIFLGETDRGLHQNIVVSHPQLFNLYEELKAIDWSHNELDLSGTKQDLATCGDKLRDVMLINLAYQWRADSAVGNNLATLFQPFSSNSEYSQGIIKIAENENLHGLTYSNITRQCIPDPQEVFDRVYECDEVLGRVEPAIAALEDLSRLGALYQLKLVDKKACERAVLKAEIAIYCLERITFMDSFAFTFALGRADMFLGAAKYVQKICQDEVKHFTFHRVVIEACKGDPRFAPYFKDPVFLAEVKEMIDGIVEGERSFNRYVLSEGRTCPDLNLELLDKWCDYNAQPAYNLLGLQPQYPLVKEDPLPWIAKDWVDINATQNANMEANNSNYALNIVTEEGGEDIDLDMGL